MAPSLLLLVFSLAALPWISAGATPAVPAIFVFGDSLADVGNNNYLNTTFKEKADFPQNGIDFPGSAPTGRFSNGYNTIDWLAKLVGHKQSPPAVLALTSEEQMLRGVNFASGGSGILDTTGTGINFTAQIVIFKRVVDYLVKQMGEERASHHLSKSLVLISTGSNDMFDYHLASGPHNTTQNEQFIASLIDKFSDQLKTLYKYGGRKFGILGLSHIGCIPVLMSQNPMNRCVEDLNGLARTFNRAAKARLHHLKCTLEGMKYSYGNVYALMSLTKAKPYLFGYEEIKSACCGSGKLNGVGPCTRNATLCSNRNQYLFWDRFHPTQVASMYTAIIMFGGSARFATPINFKALSKY